MTNTSFENWGAGTVKSVDLLLRLRKSFAKAMPSAKYTFTINALYQPLHEGNKVHEEIHDK